ncbi:hypothetical protein BRYFOR_07594 [Marvinbryantia formatexigens DSM 14469]|uniref:DUF551 domain-containing protein n=2 Tax=Marvinbryantia TaxID=248744 RepID=C6LG34_9FIRM|nr:hypothetical protein BRYFOR_07594 [Marvinbryantia formatexigens DSM 14469]
MIMAKGIIVVDMPENCKDCDFEEYRENDDWGAGSYCSRTGNPCTLFAKPDWCPIQEMPRRKPAVAIDGVSVCEFIDNQPTVGEWISAKILPERTMRVQALIRHHKWIADYDSDWVPEEEKTVHPEWMEICEAIYKNGEFTFRSMEDDVFAETAYISPEENIAKPVNEVMMYRLFGCAEDNWIPVEYPPKTDTYVLLSFSNFSMPLIGRYEADREGGAFYLGDCDGDDTCIGNDLYVNAWMPLPQSYHPKED